MFDMRACNTLWESEKIVQLHVWQFSRSSSIAVLIAYISAVKIEVANGRPPFSVLEGRTAAMPT